MDWGDVPTWVAAIAAVLALVAAALAAVPAWRTYRLAKTEAEMDQARLVVAWRTPHVPDEAVDLAVVNNSTMPVWDLTVHVLSVPSETVVQVVRSPVLPPANGPSTTATMHLGSTGHTPPTSDTDIVCATWFRDHRNVWWRRSWRGDLEKAQAPDEIPTRPPYRLR